MLEFPRTCENCQIEMLMTICLMGQIPCRPLLLNNILVESAIPFGCAGTGRTRGNRVRYLDELALAQSMCNHTFGYPKLVIVAFPKNGFKIFMVDG